MRDAAGLKMTSVKELASQLEATITSALLRKREEFINVSLCRDLKQLKEMAKELESLRQKMGNQIGAVLSDVDNNKWRTEEEHVLQLQLQFKETIERQDVVDEEMEKVCNQL